MTDYSKMSDFEINKAVASLIYSKSQTTTPYNHRPDVQVFHLNGTNEFFDYCNNPADAWPIIVDNGISLECVIVNRHEKTWRAQFKPAYVKHHANHKNPLRAAMTVFLMMQEKKE